MQFVNGCVVESQKKADRSVATIRFPEIPTAQESKPHRGDSSINRLHAHGATATVRPVANVEFDALI